MGKQIVFKNYKLLLIILGLFIISFGSMTNMPVYALGPFLRLNVTPSNIAFNIVEAEKPGEYYSGNQKVKVISEHTFPWLMLPWYLGIRSAEAYLKDSINPGNKIPVNQLRWSIDGQNFRQLSQEWALVNSYFDFNDQSYEETISYRLYPEPDQPLPAGLYTLRIEFDARWVNLPWK